jgi:transcriptional regulator with XRE-family HTH domain
VKRTKEKPAYGRGSGVPHPVDLRVGQAVRARRLILGMNQETLAKQVGLTFQQVQKYEGGANRISASRLAQFAQILGVAVDYFFMAGEIETRPEAIELMRYFAAMSGPMRAAFIFTAKTIAEEYRHERPEKKAIPRPRRRARREPNPPPAEHARAQPREAR